MTRTGNARRVAAAVAGNIRDWERPMVRRWLQGLVLLGLLGTIASAAQAETISRIRVMLHPYAAAPGVLPDAALARLQTLAGISLHLARTTRTGALELDLAQPLDRPTATALAARLRVDRNVLWAEPVSTETLAQAQSARASAATTDLGDKLMLRLAGDPAPDWPTLLPRWSAIVGAPLAVDHQVGNVWVLKLQNKVAQDSLGTMASLLQTDPVVQYADPVRRATAKLVPNDPKYNEQWALSDPVGGIDAPTGWDLGTGTASNVVAVIDTGITQHPELAGRVLPGFDFISDPASANDGNGRRRHLGRRVRRRGPWGAQLLAWHLRQRHHRGQYQQRRRHRRAQLECEDSSSPRARQMRRNVRRHHRGSPVGGRHAGGGRRAEQPEPGESHQHEPGRRDILPAGAARCDRRRIGTRHGRHGRRRKRKRQRV
jgi:hypothetical protein